MSKRVVFFDILKGYAIILVALGHCIQFQDSNFKTNPIFLWIYMFHMPLFFFVSGRFVIESCSKNNFVNVGISKVIHLLIPAFIWGAILWTEGVFVLGDLSLLSPIRFAGNVILGYWFLTTLFIFIILASIIHKSIKTQKVRYIVWICILTLSMLVNNVYTNCMTTMAPYFAFGILLKDVNLKKIPWYIHILNFIVFILLFINFKFEYTFYEKPKYDLSTLMYWQAEVIRLLSGISGILLSLGICTILSIIPYISSYLWRIGLVTLPIYCMHGILITLSFKYYGLHLSYVFYQVIAAIVAIDMSILLYKLISKSSILKLLLFGERTKPQNVPKEIIH